MFLGHLVGALYVLVGNFLIKEMYLRDIEMDTNLR